MCDFGSVVFLSLVWRVGKRERKDKNVFKIVRTEALTDAIYLMDVEAPRVAKNCLPGQFVIVRGSEDGERIPLTICDYSREAGTITIVFQVVGAATEMMKNLKVGDSFTDFVGPLGRPSELVEEDLETLKNKKKEDKTDEVKEKITNLKHELKILREDKQKSLFAEMQGLSLKVNCHDFHFKLVKVLIGGKVGFKIDSKDHAQLFAMKQLQTNLQKTFKVKQANRHLIMTNIKLLLKTKRPFYLIRTDVSSFF